MKNLALILFGSILLQGCASTLKFEPVALDGQQEVYQEGVEALISPKGSIVAIRPSSNNYQSTERPTLVISFLNGTKAPVNFSTENVTVWVDGIPLKVFTYDELVAEVKRQQAWAAVAAALNSAAQSMNAANSAYTYQSGTYTTNTYGSFNNSYGGYGTYNSYGTGTYSGYTYNPAAAQQAQAQANAQTQANMEQIRANTERSLSELSSTILKKTTVMPQTWHGGYVRLEKLDSPSQKHTVRVVVDVAGEEHEFTFEHYKLSK